MEKEQKQPSVVWRIIARLKDHKKMAGVLIALMVVVQGLGIVVPFIFKFLIDTLTKFVAGGVPLPVSSLILAGLGILFATLIGSIFQSSYNYHLFKLVTGIEDEFRNAAYEKYLRLHAMFHHGSSSGQMIGRIERGGTAIYAILNDIIGQGVLPPLLIFVGTFGALFYENIWIALAVLIPFPIYLVATRKISDKIYLVERETNKAFDSVSKEAYDVAGNVLTVKKFSQEESETDHQAKLLRDARDIQYSGERLFAVSDNVQTGIATVARVAVLVLSGWFVIRGSATIGDFFLFITLQNMAYQPLWQLSILFPRLRRNVARVEQMMEILDEPVKIIDRPGATELAPLSRAIEFKNVWFSYQENTSTSETSSAARPSRARRQWALRNLNLTIPAGTTAALVGRSGSGKTTFINMVLRSFDPQKGKIAIDGQDIRGVTQESLRRQIAVVPQEVDLFSRTVAENIAYGHPDVTRAQIEAAAKTALAHDFILRLENGYDTVVGERGIKLSGGERQRIGIARAVLRDPRLLILDEATSHLDTESERIITKATDALIKNRTSIIIAHRLSTVLRADMIVVFKDSEIEAVGTHAKLLEISPTYRKLYQLQFEDSEELLTDHENVDLALLPTAMQ